MKLFVACLFALFALAFGNLTNLELKRTVETEDKNRFETADLASNDELQKRYYGCSGDTCKSGSVKSKYCTHSAKYCFGRNGQFKFIRFDKPFRTVPKVTIGLTLIDTHKDQNVRVNVVVTHVAKHGFTLVFKPWDVSITYQLAVNWMACP